MTSRSMGGALRSFSFGDLCEEIGRRKLCNRRETDDDALPRHDSGRSSLSQRTSRNSVYFTVDLKFCAYPFNFTT